jgi:transcriptional regulator GlxA family with amidase domain
MSEFHISRLFKKATGFSPSRHLVCQRIARAQQLFWGERISALSGSVLRLAIRA